MDEGEVSADRIYDQKGITLTYADGTLGINAAQEGTAHIYDATGALVASYAVSAGQNSYSIDAAHGLYIVRVNCGDAQVTKKVCF